MFGRLEVRQDVFKSILNIDEEQYPTTKIKYKRSV